MSKKSYSGKTIKICEECQGSYYCSKCNGVCIFSDTFYKLLQNDRGLKKKVSVQRLSNDYLILEKYFSEQELEFDDSEEIGNDLPIGDYLDLKFLYYLEKYHKLPSKDKKSLSYSLPKHNFLKSKGTVNPGGLYSQNKNTGGICSCCYVPPKKKFTKSRKELPSQQQAKDIIVNQYKSNYLKESINY